MININWFNVTDVKESLNKNPDNAFDKSLQKSSR